MPILTGILYLYNKVRPCTKPVTFSYACKYSDYTSSSLLPWTSLRDNLGCEWNYKRGVIRRNCLCWSACWGLPYSQELWKKVLDSCSVITLEQFSGNSHFSEAKLGLWKFFLLPLFPWIKLAGDSNSCLPIPWAQLEYLSMYHVINAINLKK